MALEDEPLGRVLDVVRRDGRVVRDLLDDEVRPPTPVLVRPVAVEQFAENGVERPEDGGGFVSNFMQSRESEA